jgi:molybdopterin-guanine dinucleotide biosynthesis protein B
MRDRPKAVAFIASISGTGKTSLMENVVALLKAGGYRVGTVKHSRHAASMDREGSDSWRFRRAGSDVTVLAAQGQLAVMRDIEQPSLEDAVHQAGVGTDIVLVEGYKEMKVPKIEIFRSGHSDGLYCRRDDFSDPDLIAVASDIPLNLDVPLLDLNDPDMVCEFIMKYFLKGDPPNKEHKVHEENGTDI